MTTTATSPATTSAGPPAGGYPSSPLSRLRWAVSDAAAITGRNVLAYVRLPQLVVFSTIQPIMFVLIFRYVFGGAIQVPGESFVNYLMPGIFVQSVAFGAVGTGIGLATDMGTGLVERFRSLPMARSAVLAGRTFADLLRNVFVVILMVVVGYLVGFRVQTSVPAFVAGLGVLLIFGYAVSWVFSLVGMSAKNAETAQAIAFPTLFPLVFASSAFVPVETMPGWLQAFAENQPVSITVDAARALMLGGPTTSPVLQSLAWSAGILAVFGTLAVRRYRRA
ncbi:MAG TPA: ABC transporter permease [Acidimicrobiales bacterium]|nr:ABC transporter permease [Acidimicrobiales bacterium]